VGKAGCGFAERYDARLGTIVIYEDKRKYNAYRLPFNNGPIRGYKQIRIMTVAGLIL